MLPWTTITLAKYNFLSNDKILDQSKFIAIADDNIDIALVFFFTG